MWKRQSGLCKAKPHHTGSRTHLHVDEHGQVNVGHLKEKFHKGDVPGLDGEVERRFVAFNFLFKK